MSKFWFKVRKYNTCNCILKAQEHDSPYWELDCMYKGGIGKTWFTFLQNSKMLKTNVHEQRMIHVHGECIFSFISNSPKNQLYKYFVNNFDLYKCI